MITWNQTIAMLLGIALVGIGILAGYNIRGVEMKMEAVRDNTVVIHGKCKGV